MVKKLVCGLIFFSCIIENSIGMNENTPRNAINVQEKRVRFVGLNKQSKQAINQERLEKEDLEEENVKKSRTQGMLSLRLNDVISAEKNLIKAFFGNTYLEERYYNLQSTSISDDEVYWFYDNTCVGDKKVITYLIKLFPDSVFWKKMSKLVYVPRGHY